MSEERRRSLMIPGVLIGFGLAAILGLAFIPVMNCPMCKNLDVPPNLWSAEKLKSIVISCDTCKDRGKVSVLKKGLHRLQH